MHGDPSEPKNELEHIVRRTSKSVNWDNHKLSNMERGFKDDPFHAPLEYHLLVQLCLSD